jgi:hypothetical protein
VRLLVSLLVFGLASSTIYAADAPVSGKFTGNGKDAKLAFASARKGDGFDGKPTTVLIFSEKDHGTDKGAASKAAFGDFGCALVITILADGKIIGCEVAHSAHNNQGFSSVGAIKMSDFKSADGKLTGKIKTDGEQEFFKKKWDVDISFDVKAP